MHKAALVCAAAALCATCAAAGLTAVAAETAVICADAGLTAAAEQIARCAAAETAAAPKCATAETAVGQKCAAVRTAAVDPAATCTPADQAVADAEPAVCRRLLRQPQSTDQGLS